jgi:N-terminal acetyltransferase B complex catalytic subunit
MAKVEGNKENWHGHVTCLSVAPEFRRQGASKELMNAFEKTSELLGKSFSIQKCNPMQEKLYFFYF